MKINHSGNNPVQNSDLTAPKRADRSGAASRAENGRTEGADRAAVLPDSIHSDISSRGRDMSRAKAAASEAPDVREEKIAQLKSRIAAGTYHVDHEKVADRMVNEHLSSAGIG